MLPAAVGDHGASQFGDAACTVSTIAIDFSYVAEPRAPVLC